MALYNFGIPQFRIHTTRSLVTDTLVGSVALKVLNAQGALHHEWPTQSVNLGDHGPDTTVQTNLLYQDVDVPDPTPDLPDGGSIAWSFLLANAGHTDSQFVTILNKAVDGIAGGLAGKLVEPGGVTLAHLGALAAALGLQQLLNALFADCDGNVAVLGLSLTAAELAQITADPTNWLNVVNCPGTESPIGCGDNSNYDLYYSLINTNSLVNVPDLLGQSPHDARALAQQAGFGFRAVSSFTGPHDQIPVVDDQIPAPGSRVPPGSSIEAIVIFPAKGGHPL
jgi:hypothetical protein